MKKIILLTLLILLNVGCKKSLNKVITDDKTGKPMLIGQTDRSAFELPEFSDWYTSEYNSYEPDEFFVEQINKLNDSVTVQIIMGTWCSDSRREVPRFLKIFDMTDFEPNQLEIVNLNRKMKSPARSEKNKNIEFVPTFIFNKLDQEIGRIVEFPIVTLESDLFSILADPKL